MHIPQKIIIKKKKKKKKKVVTQRETRCQFVATNTTVLPASLASNITIYGDGCSDAEHIMNKISVPHKQKKRLLKSRPHGFEFTCKYIIIHEFYTCLYAQTHMHPNITYTYTHQ